MLTYLLGPFLALLPQRWRKWLPMGSSVEWRRATVLSGFGEAAIGLASLMYWYSYYMNLMVNNGLDSALGGKMGPGVTAQAIGFTALGKQPSTRRFTPAEMVFKNGGSGGRTRTGNLAVNRAR